MSNTEQAAQEASDLAEMMAAYGSTDARAEEAPAYEEPEEASTEEQETPAIELPEVTVSTLADELRDLKARVAASQSDPDTVRKMHGEIGNINRTLLAMKAAPSIDNDDDAALDLIAEEYPDFLPMINSIRKKNESARGQSPEDFDARVSEAVVRARHKEAAETLEEDHPDYMAVVATPAFESWIKTQTPERQEKVRTTWNPAVLGKALTDFSESLKVRENKQTRLANAITPQGTPQKARQSALSDEEALLEGYYGKKRS